MKRSRLGLLVLGLAGMFACGGRVLEDSGSGGSTESKPAPASIVKGSAGKSPTSGSLPSQTLGPCEPGFVRAQNPTLPCHWLTEDGLCFDDSDGACACVCPTDRDSVCAHGFDDGPNSATLIYCY